MENVLLASELVKCYHKSTISSRCTVKIDISKAFDSVQWSFLRSILSAIKIPKKFVVWIMKCVELASFSVQINGELAVYFNSSRGLRQGCSLTSAYLFVLCIQVLTKLIDKAPQRKGLVFFPTVRICISLISASQMIYWYFQMVRRVPLKAFCKF